MIETALFFFVLGLVLLLISVIYQASNLYTPWEELDNIAEEQMKAEGLDEDTIDEILKRR